MLRLLLGVLLLFVLSLEPSHGKYIQGELDDLSCWKFISRFSYVKKQITGAYLEYNLQVPTEMTSLGILLYTSDQSTGWSKVNEGFSCYQKWIFGRDFGTFELLTPTVESFQNKTSNEKYRNYRSTIPGDHNWVYLALGRIDEARCLNKARKGICNGPLKGINYTFVFRNTEAGDILQHFSADDQSMLGMTAFFFIASLVTVAASWQIATGLLERDQFHYTVQLLCASILFTFSGVLLTLIHYGEYSRLGEGAEVFRVAGKVFWSFADMSLLLQIILVAKGWTIVRRKISANGRVKIMSYLATYALMSWTLLFWYENYFDDSKATNEWLSPPGIAWIVLRIVGFLWFCYALWTTLSQFHAKKGFYTKFALAFGTWILATPLAVLAGATMEEWERKQMIFFVQMISLIVAQFLLVALYWPNAEFNKSFPFHSYAGNGGAGRHSPNAIGGVVEIKATDPIERIAEIMKVLTERVDHLHKCGIALRKAIDTVSASGPEPAAEEPKESSRERTGGGRGRSRDRDRRQEDGGDREYEMTTVRGGGGR